MAMFGDATPCVGQFPIDSERRSCSAESTPASRLNSTAMASRSPHRPVQANEERSAIALREASALMLPIARWLLRSGVPYGAFADLLKAVFVDAARHELEQGSSKVTHSALSVLSGVHRKDVRALAEADPVAAAPQRSISLASQVFARWLSDARYRDRAGRPRALDRSGARISFESLARSLSNDVHPRTVLEELIRLGLVTLEGDKVVPSVQAFVPSRKLGRADRAVYRQQRRSPGRGRAQPVSRRTPIP